MGNSGLEGGYRNNEGMKKMHIKDQIDATLAHNGWDRLDDNTQYTKRLATGGEFGSAITTIRIDETGRWLERVDGWGCVEKDIDLRMFPDNPSEAIKAVIS